MATCTLCFKFSSLRGFLRPEGDKGAPCKWHGRRNSCLYTGAACTHANPSKRWQSECGLYRAVCRQCARRSWYQNGGMGGGGG